MCLAPEPLEAGAHVANPSHDSISHTLTAIPTEEELATSTLWPEVEKVYGHGYEVCNLATSVTQLNHFDQLATIASSHDGTMIATACRATNAEHAVVRVISTTTWDPIGDSLYGHNLTVTKITFGRDDQSVLTCSRDRGWRMFRKKQNGLGKIS
jgi:elongator complex protein 2